MAKKPTRRMRSPIPWFGGKGMMAAKLLPLVPPHYAYCEPFGGGAAMLFAKEPAPVETYNDIEGGLVNMFRVLRSPRKSRRFRALCALTAYSREEYAAAKEWATAPGDVQRAYMFFVCARQSFAGRIGSAWGYARSTSTGGMAQVAGKWVNSIEGLPRVVERVRRCQIDHDDFRRVIPRFDMPDAFHYCDPPYPLGTRKCAAYAYEMSDDDHRELIELLLHIEGMAMLSGYRCELHEPLEAAGWLRKDWQTVCHAAGKTRGSGLQGKGAAKKKVPRVESVWLCPRTQKALKKEGRL